MAKRKQLHHIVSALEFQSDQLDLLDDRFVEFQQELASNARQAQLDQIEARQEMMKAMAGMSVASRGDRSYNLFSGNTKNAAPIGDPVVPSKEAGIVAALGSMLLKGGLGIGAATAGIGYLISQINDIGPSFSRLSTGLTDLENTEVTGEQFYKLGSAIGDLVSGAGVGGALGVRILAGTAFTDMAEGIERLNEADIDPAVFANIGQALGALTEDIGVFDALGASIISGSAFVGLADGVDALNNLTVDESLSDKFKVIGEGVGDLIDGLPGLTSLGEASILQAIDDNLVPLADGVAALTAIDGAKFAINAPIISDGIFKILTGTMNLLGTTGLQGIDDNLIPLADGINTLAQADAQGLQRVAGFIGPAFQQILDGTDDIAGFIGLQAIDDNLKPLADGINYVANTVDEDVQQKFLNLSNFIGPAFQRILDGTDDLLGAVGLQAIDDNLVPLSDGIKYMSDVGGEVELDNVSNIVDAYNELGRMETLAPAKVQRLAEMLGAVAPVQSQRTAVIAENTMPSGGGAVTVVNNTNNQQSTVNQSSVTNQAPSLGSPTARNGSRADAYASL